LQIPLYMKAAHKLSPQWDNVIHMNILASGSQSCCLSIDDTHRIPVSPCHKPLFCLPTNCAVKI